MRAHLGPADELRPLPGSWPCPRSSAGCALPARMSCTGRCGIGQQADAAGRDRAAAGSAACRWRSGGRSPRVSTFGSNRRAARARPAPAARREAASCRRQALAGMVDRARCRLAVRSCHSSASGTRADSPLERLRGPQPAVLAAALRSRARRRRAESQEGTWTPLVTWPTGTSASGQRGKSGWKSCRLTSPCRRLTPLTAPLPRMARYAMLNGSDGVVRIAAGPGPAAPRCRCRAPPA